MSSETFREKVDKLLEIERKRREIISSEKYWSEKALRRRIEDLSKGLANGFKEER